MIINNFNFDTVKGHASISFAEPEHNAFGTVQFNLKIEKHETVGQVEKAGKHKLAEMLEAAAKVLREHHG